jgi:predicted transcriptional regulator
VPVEFAVFTHEPFLYQRIGAEVRRMRRLGMTLHAIGRALGVDEKTVRNVLRMGTTGMTRGIGSPYSPGITD